MPLRDEDSHHVSGGDLVYPLPAEALHGVVAKWAIRLHRAFGESGLLPVAGPYAWANSIGDKGAVSPWYKPGERRPQNEETMLETFLDSLRNGTGGPLLLPLIIGLNLALGAAKDRAALQWWIAERPISADTVYGWESARRHLTLCIWFGLVSALFAVAGIAAGSALPLRTVWPAPWIAWAVATVGIAFRGHFLLEPIKRHFVKEQG